MTLPGGTEHAYGAAAFGGDGGALLAAVGGAPDFALTLWTWRDAAVVLRAPAFGRDVFRARFSPFVAGRLVTSGAGHICFWRAAATFTGRKLRGEPGRFGAAAELSDVAAFAELPDGRVLSGSEAGALLLWDGGAIKAVVARRGGAACHAGAIEALELLGPTAAAAGVGAATATAANGSGSSSGNGGQQPVLVVSGGRDGVLRLWDVAPLLGAGADVLLERSAEEAAAAAGSRAGPLAVELSPVAEVPLAGANAQVRSLLPLDDGRWLVMDGAGALVIIDAAGLIASALSGATAAGIPAPTTRRLLECHGAGGVCGIVGVPGCSVAVTAGADGSVRAVDYGSGETLQARSFAAPATCLAQLPSSSAAACRVAVGFEDGTLRLLQRRQEGWQLLSAQRPHTAAITALALSADGCAAASVSADGTAFFFDAGGQRQQETGLAWRPLGFCDLRQCCSGSGSGGGSAALAAAVAAPSCAAWAPGDERLLVGCAGGAVVEVVAPQRVGGVDTARSYRLQLVARAVAVAAPPSHLPSGATRGAAAAVAPALRLVPLAADDAGSSATTSSSLLCASSGAAALLPVMWLCGLADGRFDACFGGAGAGFVWRGSFDSAAGISPARAAVQSAAPTAVWATSGSGRYRAAGSVDGLVRIEAVSDEPATVTGGSAADDAATTNGAACCELALHDAQAGAVAGVVFSADDRWLVSAARDGAVVVVGNPLLPPPPADRQGPLPTATARLQQLHGVADAGEALAAVADLEPGAPSLEQAKLAALGDAAAAEAAAARRAREQKIEALRARLAALAAANAALPAEHRLSDAAFAGVDPGLRALAEAERAAKLARARAQAEGDAQAAASQLARLRGFFSPQMPAGAFTVRPLSAAAAGGGCEVATLHAPRLPAEVQREIDAANAAERAARDAAASLPASPKRSRAAFSLFVSTGADKRVSIRHPGTGPGTAAATTPTTGRASVRQTERQAREARWAALNARKPGAAADAAPHEAAAAMAAAASIGDVKLRSDPTSVHDEEGRATPHRKRLAMAQLAERSAHEADAFNAALAALVGRRQQAQGRLRVIAAGLSAINSQLAERGRPAQPDAVLPCSVLAPHQTDEERRTAVSRDELATHAARKQLAAAEPHLGSRLSVAAAATDPLDGGGSCEGGGGCEGGGAAQQLPSSAPLDARSVRRLEAEAGMLAAEARVLCAGFDNALATLLAERRRLEGDFAGAVARQLVYHQELLLLKVRG